MMVRLCSDGVNLSASQLHEATGNKGKKNH